MRHTSMSGHVSLGVPGVALLLFALLPLPVSAAHGPTVTITTDTILTADLTGHIVIATDNITLDCDGHKVTGSGSGTGIFLDQTTGVTVKNCFVDGFSFGVELRGASDNHLFGLTASDNVSAGIFLQNIGPLSSSDNIIEKNSTVGNGVGIRVDADSDSNRIRKNLVYGNVIGIELDFADDNRIERNSTVNNRVGGIRLFEESDNNLISQNTVSRNGTPEGPNNVGILIFGSDDNRVEKNSVTRTVDGPGIRIQANSSGTLVERNLASRNGGNGITVETAATTVTKNEANKNGDLGIEAVPGVTDGGGNKASGNGNPAQCTNVACS